MYNLTIERESTAKRGRPREFYRFDGIRMTGTQWAAHLGVSVTEFYRRLKRHQARGSAFPAWRIFREHFGDYDLPGE